jgi:L-ascorbate metabolism protein UlaG (beta-lactamase superfamily)
MYIENIEIKWLGHAGFLIKNNINPDKIQIIYIDPYNIKETSEKADLIFITHDHYDHCSIADINKIIKEGTKIVVPADSQNKITRFDVPIKIEVAVPEKEFVFGDLKVSTLPAYNIDKPFHSQKEEWMGYLLKMNGLLIYHAGDSDVIPEMQKLTGYGDKKLIALLPVGGRFTMTPEEAVQAARIIKPFLAVPMHYGSIVGTEENAKEFIELCKEAGINAEIFGKE